MSISGNGAFIRDNIVYGGVPINDAIASTTTIWSSSKVNNMHKVTTFQVTSPDPTDWVEDTT